MLSAEVHLGKSKLTASSGVIRAELSDFGRCDALRKARVTHLHFSNVPAIQTSYTSKPAIASPVI